MVTPRNTPGESGGNKLLWTGAAAVLVVVLAMGVTLMRLQAQPQQPQPGVLPAAAPPSAAPPVLASAATEPARSAASVPPATTAADPLVDTPKPRIVQPRTSEPAVARAPQRATSTPEPVDRADAQPGVKR